MAKKASLSLIELHLEKLLLGLAVLGTLGLVVYYGMGPNKVTYRGQEMSPEELDQAILSAAQDLQQRLRRATPETSSVPDYSGQLERSLNEGVFGAAEEGPAIPTELPLAANFGTPLPRFEDQEEAQDLELVTPLAPRALALRTGISLGYRRPLQLAAAAGGLPEPASDTGDEQAQAFSWVTIGGYFPRDQQRRDMTSAGYAGYRAKVYVTGIDVQRQEMLASGEFSDWEDVQPAASVPEVKVPTPVIDDRTGQVLNADELDRTLYLVRDEQRKMLQPPFHEIESGDEWAPPPLEGVVVEEEEEEEQEEADEPVAAQPSRGGRGTGMAPTGRPTGGRGGRFGGARGGRGGSRGGRGGSRGGRGGGATRGGGGAAPAPSQQNAERRERIEARKQLQQALQAWREKDYENARRFADQVLAKEHARISDKRKAERLKERIEKILSEDRGPGDGFIYYAEFVKHPDREDVPAVWVHDDSVEPGKTYRYRMRVRLWNRYVGRMDALRNPSDARRTELVGEWSLPTEPVTVAPKQHFFVTGRAFGEPAARVDVFTWHGGNWLRERFEVQVGDTIGGIEETRTGEFDEKLNPVRDEVNFSTGAVVLDLRFDEPLLQRRSVGDEGEFSYSEREGVVLVYLDPADGQVKERTDVVDRYDPLYKRLKREYEELIE